MKKFLWFCFMVFFMQACMAAEQYSAVSGADNDEIILDITTPKKDYNLRKKDYRNNPESYNNADDDIDLPFDFTPLPLQLLKQQQKEGF